MQPASGVVLRIAPELVPRIEQVLRTAGLVLRIAAQVLRIAEQALRIAFALVLRIAVVLRIRIELRVLRIVLGQLAFEQGLRTVLVPRMIVLGVLRTIVLARGLQRTPAVGTAVVGTSAAPMCKLVVRKSCLETHRLALGQRT